MKALQFGANWVRLSFGAIGLALTIGLAACGGGGSTNDAGTVDATKQALSAVVAPGVSVIAVTKVSETRVSRTVYDYVFKVTVQNGNLAQMGVTANLTAVGTGTSIMDGSAVIGDMNANALVTSTDTITLRHDRTFAFDQGALRWSVTSTASAGTFADAGLASVRYGAASDGNLYGIGGVNLNKSIDVDSLAGSVNDQFALNISCGAPKVSAPLIEGKWRLGISASDLPAGSEVNVCLQIVNLTAHKFVVIPFKTVGLVPTNSATTSIPPSGSGTLTTVDGYVVTLVGNILGKTVNARLVESQDPDGDRIVAITFDTDVSNAGIAIKLPDLNVPPPLKVALAARRIQAFAAAPQPTKLPDTLPDPYPENNDNLGKKWDGVTKAWLLHDKVMRIPQTKDQDQYVQVNGDTRHPDAGWLCNKFTKPNETSCSTITVKHREVSALYSVLEQKSWDIGDAEVVIFINGFNPQPDYLDPALGGGRGTWGEFPRLAKNPKLFGGKRLIPFEFRWATNARFSDVADDLAKSINLIRANLNLTSTPKIHLVAHSFGGLTVRTLLQGLATHALDPNVGIARGSIKSVLTLGSPHSGIQTVSDNLLPAGQDLNVKDVGWIGFSRCGQVSCYEAGLKAGILTSDQINILYGNGVGYTLPLELAKSDLARQLPPIDFYVGIGLRRDSVGQDSGDLLISFDGQRFKPSSRQSDNLLNQAPSTLAARVREVILGSPSRGAGVPSMDTLPTTRKYGYAHQAKLPALRPNSGLVPLTAVTDGVDNGWGLETGVTGDCETGQDSTCAHAGVLLLRELLTASVPVVTLLTPGTMVANNVPQPITITGANFLSKSVVQTRSGFDSWVTVPNWVTEPNPDPGNLVSSTQITVMVNPGLATNVFGIRVCRGGYAITDADCSAEFRVTATKVDVQPAPPSNFPTTDCKGKSTVLGGWTRFGTATYNQATNTYSVGDTIGYFDANDVDGDCNTIASWTPGGGNTQDNDWLVYNRSTTGDIDFSAEACISYSPQSGHSIGLFTVDPAFTGLPQSGHQPFIGGVIHFSTQWNLPGRLYVAATGVSGPIFIPNAVMTANGFCGTYRVTRVGNLYSAYFNNSLVIGGVVGTTAAIVPAVVAYDDVITMTPTVRFPN